VRILILGGTRLTGPFAVRELAGAGHEVRVFHRGEHEPELPAVHVHGDFADFAQHADELRAFEPEVVIDTLAVRAGDIARVATFADTASHAVVLSSADVYRAFGRIWRSEPGPPDPVPLGEDSPLRAKVFDPEYDKLGVEAAARELDLPVTILRLTGVYGPGDFQHRLWSYVKRMHDGRPAILLDRALSGWRWARVYVEDAAHAIVLVATDERAAGKTYNVAAERAFSEAEWVAQIASVRRWQGRVVAAPASVLPDYLRQDDYDLRQDYVVDSSRIRSELGYEEIADPTEALRRTGDWELANPPDTKDLDPRFVDRFDYDAEDEALSLLAQSE